MRTDRPEMASAGGSSVGHLAAMRCSPKVIGLFGGFGCGNFGNDGSLEAMLDFLWRVRPDAALACICTGPDKVQGDHRIPSFPMKWPRSTNVLFAMFDRLLFTIPSRLVDLVHAFKNMRNVDLLIIPGTGILDDFGERPWGTPFVLFSSCVAARLCGAKIAFVSIGAGPIHHPISRWLMKSAAGMAHYRSYRDTVSRDFMVSIARDTRKDSIYPDIVFRLPSPSPSDLPRPESTAVAVGVGVMAYYGWDAGAKCGATIYDTYIKKLTRFVLWLLDQGYRVRILVGENNDRRAVDDLTSAVHAERKALPEDQLVSELARSLHDLMRQIAETDVVVATRYHNVVCALKLGKPTVSIGYAAKNEVLMAEMGLRSFCQHVEALDVDLLIGQFSKLTLERRNYERGIREKNRALQERLDHQESLLVANFL